MRLGGLFLAFPPIQNNMCGEAFFCFMTTLSNTVSHTEKKKHPHHLDRYKCTTLPYRPNLTPSDFYLFSYLKGSLPAII